MEFQMSRQCDASWTDQVALRRNQVELVEMRNKIIETRKWR